MLILVSSIIADRYLHLSDFANGVLKGISIGLLLLAIILPLKQKMKPSRQ